MRTDKVPPHNLEAEQAVLCAMLINPDSRPKIKSQLHASDFYWEKHQTLFPVITETDGDLIAIHDELMKKGFLEKSGGKEYLASLVDAVSTSAAVQYHVDIVKELSRKRKFVSLAESLLDKAHQLTSEELSSYVRESLNTIDIRDSFGVKQGVDIENVFTPEKMLKKYASHIETLKENRLIIGIHEIDKRIRGVAGGEVCFIIARAGSFKTAILQNLLKNYIQNSAWGAAFFSIEMPVSSLAERYHEIVHGSTGKDIEEIYVTTKKGASEIREGLEMKFIEDLENLFVVPTKVSILDVAQYIKLIQKEYKVKIGVVGIDYIGLMDGEGQGEYEVISKLARDCKGLAKMLNLPVIVLSQTSRRAGSGDVEISLDMGRGSGAIEEAADFVLGLYQVEREKMAIEDPEPDQELICKILKNRKGPKGSRWRLDLDPTNLRIGSDAELWEPPKKKPRSYDD
jgi:replicative DNA helicase